MTTRDGMTLTAEEQADYDLLKAHYNDPSRHADMLAALAIISRLQSLPSGLAGDVRDAALEEAAQCADRVGVPGSGRPDALKGDIGTGMMIGAISIAQAIRSLKSPTQARKGE